MNILVISDSHGIHQELVELLSYYRDKVDVIVHCGDSELDSQDTTWLLTDAVVRGNMDFDKGYSDEKVLEVGGKRIFITHGHLFNVNVSRTDLALKAKRMGADIALYGHTHVLNAQVTQGVLCVNPGSLKQSRGLVRERTFALVTIDDSVVDVRYYKADHTHINGLEKQFNLQEYKG